MYTTRFGTRGKVTSYHRLEIDVGALFILSREFQLRAREVTTPTPRNL